MSLYRIRDRVSDFVVNDWMLDNGAYAAFVRNGGRHWWSVREFLDRVLRWSSCGSLEATFAQDYLAGSGPGYQDATVDRFVATRQAAGEGFPVLIAPVLHGVCPSDYVRHAGMYDGLLAEDEFIGVGSLVPLSRRPLAIRETLEAIKAVRPGWRLHGFGLKLGALSDPAIQRLLYSADSMAWSYSARKQGRSSSDYREAVRFCEKVEARQGGPVQNLLF